MTYYRTIFAALCIIVVITTGAFLAVCGWCKHLRVSYGDEQTEVLRELNRRNAGVRDVRLLEDEVRPLRNFTKAWEPYLHPAAAKDVGNHLRNVMATLATRTGLTSEGATVPAEPRPYAVGGSQIRVQQISLNVVSESLPAIVTWLGAVEGQFPYARVESLILSSYASRSVQLGITLLQPVEEISAPSPAVASTAAEKSSSL
jgi:hypothetical protein